MWEPDHPVSTNVRAHHDGLVVGDSKLVALDHDFHVAGIVPSVCFMIDIQGNPRDSFYNGTVHVGVKDKVFESSSPLRHATEIVSMMRKDYSGDDVNSSKPILIRYTDGGPDHRTTYKSVKIASLIEFIALDLDMIVCARTAQCLSYNNPAECCMSLLNVGLQNVALERPAMSPEYEIHTKALDSLKSTRKLAEKNASFRTAYQKSMKEPIKIISDRFERLKWKGEQ